MEYNLDEVFLKILFELLSPLEIFTVGVGFTAQSYQAFVIC